MITTAADFIQMAKEYRLPNQQKSMWEQFLMNTTEQYQGLSQQAQDVASYDISEAYANYKKQQLQLQMNQQLGAGFQQQVGEDLQTAYGSAYSNIKTKEASNLYKIETEKEAAIEKGEKEISRYGEFAKKLETAIYDFASSELKDEYNLSDMSNIYKPVEEGGLGFYKTTQDSSGNVTYELTDYGKDFYDKILHSSTTSLKFAQYLQEEGLYDEYTKNADFYNAIVGGLEYGDRGYSEGERLVDLKENEKQTAITNLKNTVGDTAEFDYNALSTQQADTLRKNIQRNENLVSTKVDVSFKRGENITDDNGQKWFVYDENPKRMDRKKEYEIGDIIKEGDKYYMIVSFAGSRAAAMELEKGGRFPRPGAVKKVSLFN